MPLRLVPPRPDRRYAADWQASVVVLCVLAVLFAFLIWGCGPVTIPPPPPPPPPRDFTADCRDISLQDYHREPSAEFVAVCLAEFRRPGATDPAVRAALYARFPRPTAPAAPVLHTDGKLFRTADGQAWRYKGVTAFKLLALHAAGADIQPFLEAYKGFNVLRVFTYALGGGWGARGWDVPTAAQTRAFLAFVGARGWTVELVLLTDGTPAKLPWARTFLRELAAAPRPTNLLIELVNEPGAHNKHDPTALKADAEASGFLYTSGGYASGDPIFGRYGVAHLARTDDFPRRAHDLLEYYSGGGPHTPDDPAHKVPWVSDEPGKPQDVPTDEGSWRAFFGAVAVFGAGGTFHCETCKYGERPTALEQRLAAVALEGLSAFPADAPLGPYRRIVESGQAKEARTYVVGRYMVRCQQRGTAAPEAGWTSIDPHGVLWKR